MGKAESNKSLLGNINKGDRIRIEKGEHAIEGRVSSLHSNNGRLYVTKGGYLDIYLVEGYAIILLEKAKAVMPTKTGIYLDKRGQKWALVGKDWHLLSDWKTHTEEQVDSHAPFTPFVEDV